MAQTIAQKMYIKPGSRILLINAPEGYVQQFAPLPEGATVETTPNGTYDVVQGFMKSQAEVDSLAPQAMNAVKVGGGLWLCYPKGTSKIKSDINRDKGWDMVTNAGWGGIRLISLDDTWSAMMFRQESDIQRKANSQAPTKGKSIKKASRLKQL